MARFGDRGAYEVGNIRICTVAENMKERRLTTATRAKLSAANRRRWAVWNEQLTEQDVQAAIAVAMSAKLATARKGKKASAETRAKMSAAFKQAWARGAYWARRARRRHALEHHA